MTFSNTTAVTVAFRSHISLFLLLSFLWVLFLTPRVKRATIREIPDRVCFTTRMF